MKRAKWLRKKRRERTRGEGNVLRGTGKRNGNREGDEGKERAEKREGRGTVKEYVYDGKQGEKRRREIRG